MKLRETNGVMTILSDDEKQKVEVWKVSKLKNYIDNLGETIGKLSWISSNCGDVGLKLLLEDIEHELMQAHEYFRYHEEEGLLQERDDA